MLSNILNLGAKLIDKVLPDPIQRAKAQALLVKLHNEGHLKEIEQGAETVRAEANGESWLQRNWRPLIMLMFGGIILNNYILYPYLSLFTDKTVSLPIPEDMWELIKIGLGGYVLARSAEKGIKAWKGRP